MDIKLLFHVILCHFTLFCGGNVYKTRPRSCTNSADCPVGFCCRDSGGNLINGEGFSELRPIENNPTVNGTCRRGPSKPDAVCTDRCGCTRGYTCYRTITGACCPPTTCWERKAAAKDKKFWENCKPPKCFFPPSANPGPLNGPVN